MNHLCGKEMRGGKTCGLKDGHQRPHRSVESVEALRAYGREYQRERHQDPEFREAKSARDRERYRKLRQDPEFCVARNAYQQEYRQTLKGRDAHRRTEGSRRARKANATYEDLLYLDTIDYPCSCYICGTSDGPFEIEHVVPVSRWDAFAVECEETPVSAIRWACESCNASKSARPLAEYHLDRWQRGLPVMQAAC